MQVCPQGCVRPGCVCWSPGNRFVGARAGHLPRHAGLGPLPLAEEEEEPRAAMKGLSRLVRAGEDAAQGAVAASHEGRESAGVGGEAVRGAAQSRLPGPRPAQPSLEAACQAPSGLLGLAQTCFLS